MKFSPEEIEQYRSVTERVSNGSQLTASPKLREFLNYIVDCALRECPEEASEQQIGVNVFGRKPGYNSSEDSIVRSQARLLRQKLASFFKEEGASEPITIEIPKGHYLPVFKKRSTGDASLPAMTSALSLPTVTAPESRGRISLGVIFILVALATGLVLGYALPRRGIASAQLRDPLWAPFLNQDQPPLVIYSNPIFRGAPLKEGLRLLPPGTASDAPEDDTYTGTGEAQAIYTLTRFFDRANRDFVLKRSRLVTWDDAKSRNLVFLGAATQNTALAELPRATQFVIRLDSNAHGYVSNEHPLAGEPHEFVTDGSDEYAIVALLPGLEPSTRILAFTGLTTVGTQSAVEFALDPIHRADLAKRAGLDHNLARPFEALLRVHVRRNVGLDAEIVAFHTR
ncbi:hypothetical protein [Terriglobus albidus]|uniref:hypothetical protein n=1 Tax=Terriglobus albidus TaxID=1592106 RepID=UPI0021E07B58|nr:hypothetical protein [Terriglobus albidus]